MPRIIGALIATKAATLTELQTVLGVEDAYNLLEVMAVDSFNRQAAASDGSDSN